MINSSRLADINNLALRIVNYINPRGIWYFTGYIGGFYDDSTYLQYLRTDPLSYNAYYDILNRDKSGEIIPDHYTVKYNSTHTLTYDFVAFKPVNGNNYQMLLFLQKSFHPRFLRL